MKLLAIDTATEACSAALLCDDDVRQKFEVAPRLHGELILGMIDALLAEAGISHSAIDGLAFGRGPGAFTGVRIGVATAQAIGLGLERPLYPISNLAALAYGAWRERRTPAVLAAMDARMGEIYAGAFLCSAGQAQTLMPEQVIAPADWRPPGRDDWHAAGSGWQAYAPILQRLPGLVLSAIEPARLPQAQDIARLAVAPHLAGAGVSPEAAMPVYLRDQVASKPSAPKARG